MNTIKKSAALPKTVMFDIDGTLIDAAQTPLKDQVAKYKALQAQGVTVGVWSRRGPGYAKMIRDKLGLTGKVAVKGSIKPDVAYDNEEDNLGVSTIKVGIAHGQRQ